MAKQVRNLLDELVNTACKKAGREQDHRFRPWAKTVTSVNTKLSNGYCFGGEFVNDGTVEVEIKPQVFLVKTSSGSYKYQTSYYNIIVMDVSGKLAATDIQTNDKTRGWAPRIRGQVDELLQTLDAVTVDYTSLIGAMTEEQAKFALLAIADGYTLAKAVTGSKAALAD